MTEINKALFDFGVHRQLDLTRYGNGVVRDILALLNDAEAELVEKIRKRGERGPWTTARLKALLAELRELSNDAYWDAQKLLTKEMKRLAKDEAEVTAEMLAAQFPPTLSVVQPGAAQLAAIVDKTPITVGVDRKLLLEEIFVSLAAGKEEAIRGAVRLGVVQGETVDQMVRRLRGTRAAGYKDGVLETSRRHAEAVVRTVVNHTSNQAVQKTYAENGDLVRGWRFLATLDDRVTILCSSTAAKNLVYPIGQGPLPPLHVNCLTGDALVSSRSRIAAVSKRWFDGNLIIIKTASGRIFTSTPNHPVLTPSGWVAAGLLNVGGHVISYGGSEGGRGINGDNEDVPTRIEDIAEAFFNRSEMVSVPVPLSPIDFHGDGVGSKVAVIGADRLLWGSHNTPFSQHIPQSQFVAGDNLAPTLRPKYQIIKRGFFSSDCIMSRLSDGLPLLWSGARHAGKLLFTSISRLDTVFFKKLRQVHRGTLPHLFSYAPDSNTCVEQPDSLGQVNSRGAITSSEQRYTGFYKTGSDGLMIDPVFCGKVADGSTSNILSVESVNGGQRGCPADNDASFFEPTGYSGDTDAKLASKIASGASGPVFPDEIVSVDSRVFSGHVYNLQTEENWYVADGVVSHNCRSFAIPELKTWKELGIDLDEMPPSERASQLGPVKADITTDEWMHSLPKETQKEVLGVTRQKLFEEGNLKMNSFVSDKGTVYTLDQLKERHRATFSRIFG